MAKRAVDIPVMAIIRPRMAGFYYSEDDFDAMCFDARHLLELGADGIVFGFLSPDGSLDYERCARFVELARGKQTVFHRAIDITRDPFNAVERLARLGVTRILTSGFSAGSYDGRAQIGALQKQFGAVSYTHLRAHETGRNLVCRLLLEKKKNKRKKKNN